MPPPHTAPRTGLLPLVSGPGTALGKPEGRVHQRCGWPDTRQGAAYRHHQREAGNIAQQYRPRIARQIKAQRASGRLREAGPGLPGINPQKSDFPRRKLAPKLIVASPNRATCRGDRPLIGLDGGEAALQPVDVEPRSIGAWARQVAGSSLPVPMKLTRNSPLPFNRRDRSGNIRCRAAMRRKMVFPQGQRDPRRCRYQSRP